MSAALESAAEFRQQIFVGGVGEGRRSLLDSGQVCAQSCEAQCPVVLNAEGIGDGEDVRRLRGAGLRSPVVDRVAVYLAALGKPCLGLALSIQGGFDQFEERSCGGVVTHTSMSTEMTSVVTPISLSICAQSSLDSPRDAQRTEGASDMYLSTAQACGRLNISKDTLRKRIRAGELTAIKGEARNSHVRVSIASIEAYEERRRIAREGSAA